MNLKNFHNPNLISKMKTYSNSKSQEDSLSMITKVQNMIKTKSKMFNPL